MVRRPTELLAEYDAVVPVDYNRALAQHARLVEVLATLGVNIVMRIPKSGPCGVSVGELALELGRGALLTGGATSELISLRFVHPQCQPLNRRSNPTLTFPS